MSNNIFYCVDNVTRRRIYPRIRVIQQIQVLLLPLGYPLPQHEINTFVRMSMISTLSL